MIRIQLLRNACAAVALASATLPARLVLEGFVPPSVTADAVLFEYRRLSNLLYPGLPPDTAPLTITFFNEKDSRNNTYSLPEWGGGGAVGKDHIVVALDAEPFLYTDFMQITAHELVHIIINRRCEPPIPRWFHEGVAMALSGEVTFTEQSVISQAILAGRLLMLDDIDSVNSFGRFRARLAYAQSHQAVRFLIDNYGMEVIGEILSNAHAAGSFRGGVRETLQLSENELESMIRQYLIRNFRLAFFIADTYLIWIAILVLFLTGYTATVVRNRKKAALMVEQEKSLPKGAGEKNGVESVIERMTGEEERG